MNYNGGIIMLQKLFWNPWIKRILRAYYVWLKRDNIALARLMGVKIGTDCVILNDPTNIFSTEPWLVTIGNHVEICSGVEFNTHDGAMWVARGLYPEKYKNVDRFLPIRVGDNVMIGSNVFILPGVTIGSNVVIGAGSIVTKNVPDNSVFAGAPAKKISTYDEHLSKIDDDLYFTKEMNPNEKKDYIKKIHPEWFI